MGSYIEAGVYAATLEFPGSWEAMPRPPSELSPQSSSPDKGSISPACTACRERHLKCDGNQPTCARCQATDQSCQYVRSRRGHRPPRKKTDDTLPGAVQVLPARADQALLDDQALYQPSRVGTIAKMHGLVDGSSGLARKKQELSLSSYRSLPNIHVQSGHASSKLHELYYAHFHDAHPILIPEVNFRTQSSTLPACTIAIVEFIGASFSTSANKTNVGGKLAAANVNATTRTKSGHMVQALLLLAIAQHSMDLPMEALQTLDAAIDMALELGMNADTFRCDCCNHTAILRESWRRTWWELYVINGILAAVHMKTFFRLHTQEALVALPCEESVYKSGEKYERNCQYINDMDEMAFQDDDVAFSSYAYRITAIREMGNLLVLNHSFCPTSTEIVIAVDSALQNWLLHLPKSKETPLDENGQIDEMMFQAHAIVNAARIFLHRPRSDLIFTHVQDTTTCTPARRIAVPANRYAVHTAKAVESADRIAGLITLPGPIKKHTPLFTCMVTLQCVVHLSAYVITRGVDQRANIKERLTLGIGALKTVRETWAVADSVLQRVKAAAREIMALRKPQDAHMLEHTNINPELYDLAGSQIWLEGVYDPLFNEIAGVGPSEQVVEPMLYAPATHAL